MAGRQRIGAKPRELGDLGPSTFSHTGLESIHHYGSARCPDLTSVSHIAVQSGDRDPDHMTFHAAPRPQHPKKIEYCVIRDTEHGHRGLISLKHPLY